MALVHPLVTAANASVKQTAGRGAPSEDGQDVSFAAVLSAQLGAANSSELSDLIAGALPAAAGEPKADSQSDPRVLNPDPTTQIPLVGLPIPVVPQVVPVVRQDASESARIPSPAERAAAVSKEPVLDLTSAVEREPVALPAVAQEITSQTTEPANFAAVLQSLPQDNERSVRSEHAKPAADAAGFTPPVAMPADTRTDATRHAASVSTNVSVPVQDARWTDAFSERVVWAAGQQVQSAEIHVEPAQLGPIEVRISVVNDQANLLFTAPHAVAREAIQMSLPRLQDMFLNSGLTLGNVSVGAHNAGNSANQQREGSSRGSQGSEMSIDTNARQSVTPLRRGSGLVDLFA